jgi:hypothetical protein
MGNCEFGSSFLHPLPNRADFWKITARDGAEQLRISASRSARELLSSHSTRDGDMAERSKYQQKIIKNYYNNQGAISLQRLSELVTELYLAEGKARAKQWTYIVAALEKLKVPKPQIEHLQKKDDPALVAKLVQELMAKQ